MPYTIEHKIEQDYIAVTVEGDFALATLKELAEDIAHVIEQFGCRRILNDIRQANLVKGAFEIYNMPQAAKNAGVTAQCKRALVVAEQSSDFYFLETVFINQGHQVKMFTDMEEAITWLLYN